MKNQQFNSSENKASRYHETWQYLEVFLFLLYVGLIWWVVCCQIGSKTGLWLGIGYAIFLGLYLLITLLGNDGKEIVNVNIHDEETLNGTISYFIERVLREERVKSKRVDYYNSNQPFSSRMEFQDKTAKLGFIIVWRKEGKVFEIAQCYPYDIIFSKVETFGKRTDKVIKEVIKAVEKNILPLCSDCDDENYNSVNVEEAEEQINNHFNFFDKKLLEWKKEAGLWDKFPIFVILICLPICVIVSFIVNFIVSKF